MDIVGNKLITEMIGFEVEALLGFHLEEEEISALGEFGGSVWRLGIWGKVRSVLDRFGI